MILDERTARQQLVEEAAHKIMIAARMREVFEQQWVELT